MKKFRLWISEVSGATAIEYSLIAAGVSLAVAAFIFAFGDELYAFFGQLTSALDGVI
jgi:pilus assembly protein Flp/PilA